MGGERHITRHPSSDTRLNSRRILTLISSFVVTALFLALALYPVDFAKLVRAFASADYRLVAVATLFTFLGLLFVWRTGISLARMSDE